jgi:hypothetical protein
VKVILYEKLNSSENSSMFADVPIPVICRDLSINLRIKNVKIQTAYRWV